MHVETHIKFSTSAVFKSKTRNFSIYVTHLRKSYVNTLNTVLLVT